MIKTIRGLIKIIFSDLVILNLKILYSRIFRKKKFALNGIDEFLVSHLPKKGFYIEIGGNDGVTQSNTYLMGTSKSWSGILIEPNYSKYLLCKKFRPRDVVVNAACVSFHFKKEFIYLSNANLESSIIQNDLSNEKFIAPATTLTQILDSCGAPQNIDFLSLDVEGAELEVIKGLDFAKYKIKTILFEERGDTKNMQVFLENCHYKLVKQLTHHDYVYELEK